MTKSRKLGSLIAGLLLLMGLTTYASLTFSHLNGTGVQSATIKHDGNS